MGDRYRLRQLFARGGMAEVYLGVAAGAQGFEKPVVIKRVHPHLAADPRIAKMFTAEARLASHLHHQNIVEVLDVGSGPEGLFLVMELVDGWDLGRLLERTRELGIVFPPELVAYVGLQVLSGLNHAYKKRVDGSRLVMAHRDVSPSNILISTEGEVKLADFGIARAEVASGATEPGTFKGKLAYAAPEQMRGEATDALSDQFALGLVLYEMATGRPAFGNPDANLVEYVQRLAEHAPLEPPGVPPPLADLIRIQLNGDRAARFQTPEQLGRALTEYLARSAAPASSAELQSFAESLAPGPSTSVRAAAEGSKSDTVIRSAFSLVAPVPLTVPSPASDYAMMLSAEGNDWSDQGRPVMDAEGKLHADAPRTELAHVTPALPPTVQQSESLELDTRSRAPRSEPVAEAPIPEAPVYRETAPKGPDVLGGLRKAGLWAGLLALAAAAYVMYPRLGLKKPELPSLPTLTTTGATRVLNITSSPDGAQVVVEGQALGETPYAVENTYPDGVDLELSLTKRGYQIWRGRFRGGTDVRIDARLVKR